MIEAVTAAQVAVARRGLDQHVDLRQMTVLFPILSFRCSYHQLVQT
jgi:hypothetical protein